jgi:hypothetical protein
VLAEPQPVAGDVVVTLPATFAVTVTITLADGKPAPAPRLRLLAGKAGQGAAEMHLLGFVPPIDLTARQQAIGDGQWRIDNLQPGTYTLVADAPGHAMAFAGFELTTADAAVALQLTTPNVFHVVVVDPEDQPVRNATVFAETRGTRLLEMPVNCGRTGADGRLAIDVLPADSLRVSAEHPRWGVVHGETKPGEELRLQMQPPATLRGFLFENGQPPAPGKFSIAVMRRRGNGPSGPLDTVPGLLTPGLDGAFEVKALQPGSYRLMPVDSLETLRSPGGVMALAQNAFLMRDVEQVEVELTSGQTHEVVIEAGTKPIDGPTATLAGSVTVNGRLAAGYAVSAFGSDRRFSARVDERGRFDLGVVPAGQLWVNVQSVGEDGMFLGLGGGLLWSASLTLAQAEARELTIDVTTSSLSGTCQLPDGGPAAGVYVQVQGRLKGSTGEDGQVWLGGPTDANGRFAFTNVAEGTYSLSVRGGGENALRGELAGVEVRGSLPVDTLRIELRQAMVVKGRVDLASFGNDKPRWCWLQFERVAGVDGQQGEGTQMTWAGIDRDDGSFSSDDLSPGRYRIRIHAGYEGDRENAAFECAEIDVPPSGLADLQLRPGKRVE